MQYSGGVFASNVTGEFLPAMKAAHLDQAQPPSKTGDSPRLIQAPPEAELHTSIWVQTVYLDMIPGSTGWGRRTGDRRKTTEGVLPGKWHCGHQVLSLTRGPLGPRGAWPLSPSTERQGISGT